MHVRRLRLENVRLKRMVKELTYESPRYQIVGNSTAIRKVLHLVEKVAATDATVLVRGPSGKQLYFISQVQDITAAKRIQDDLDRFFNLSRDLICVASVDGYFKRMNPAGTQILGYSEAVLTSKPLEEFIYPEDRAATRAELASLGSGVPTISFENRYVCADGTVKWLSWHATPVASEGLVYAIARDVTDQRRAVEAISEARLVSRICY